ncbi:hypothetical protein G4D82_12440 [Flavobacterium sp. CYK-4]|uniref:hypothetical protein n=1 Tax=Flavobacterium lotistagni TaxID=2709660 RepID=UPI00140C4C4A|nr:hypothetical protein [Flavobacterium lotistagni]NHM08032.1 hypothetical protein [Flavobacterium lotistagni]
MDAEYNVGTGSNKVYLEIITTPEKNGVLVTPEVIFYPDSKPQPTQQQAGDFNFKYDLGTRNQIKGGMLTVEMVFDLKNLTTGQRKQFFDDLKIKYKFTGGIADDTFKHDPGDIKEDSDNGEIIITRKDFFLN